ncbi:MAG: RDD family protein [Pseudomonadota bacterium]
MSTMTGPDLPHLPHPVRDAAFYAGVPAKRLVAWFVDAIVIFALTLVIIPFTLFTAFFYLPLLWLVLSFAYRTVTIARGSATWGMRFMGIELRTARGTRFELGDAAAHTAIHTVAMAFVLPQIASVILMLTTPRGQGLPDLALNTVALNQRR